MRFTHAFLAALSAAAAQAVIITNSNFTNIAVGTPFVITYSDAVGPVTIFLGTGDPGNVIQGDAIGTSAGPTGSITWTPTSGGNFALKIMDAGAAVSSVNPNYSGFFPVAGPVLSTTSMSTATTTSTQTTASVSTSSVSTSLLSTVTTTALRNSTTLSPTTITTSMMSRNATSTITPTSTTTRANVPSQLTSGASAAGLASPFAFVIVAFAALLTLN